MPLRAPRAIRKLARGQFANPRIYTSCFSHPSASDPMQVKPPQRLEARTLPRLSSSLAPQVELPRHHEACAYPSPSTSATPQVELYDASKLACIPHPPPPAAPQGFPARLPVLSAVYVFFAVSSYSVIPLPPPFVAARNRQTYQNRREIFFSRATPAKTSPI